MAAKGEETALGTARGRFIESLPRKAIELRGAIALLTATPAAEGPREDMRRRLHTLYASALVFRNDSLAQAVKEGIDKLDAARDDSRALSSDDLDLLTLLVKRLPELRGEETGTTIAPNGPVPGLSAPPASPAGASTPAAAPDGPAPTPIAEVRNPSTAIGLQPVPGAAVSMSGRPPSEVRAPRTLLGMQPVPSAENSRREPTATGLGVPVPNPFAGPPQGGGMQQGQARTGDTRTRAGVNTVRDGTRIPVLSRVLHVLVLSPAPVDTELSAAIATPSLTVSLVHTVRAALEAARSHAPDVIAADAQLAQAGVLVGSLRGDPLTDFLPVVLLESLNQRLDIDEGRALGADDVITRPFHAPRLVRALGRVTGTLIEGGSQLALPPTATLDELSSHVAEEIRRGIVEAAETGRDLKVPLGEGAEVLAAAWAAVARVRAFVTQQTAGKVRFSDRVLRAGASFLVLGQDASPRPEPEPGQEKPLLGRRILVVDDDTAVVWFFAGVLREEGATVLESTDGRDALLKARSERPDVLISDILMPGLDGFALCRELKRDPALADVPVILISWKEDLIARMRELSAGASGYLRKEAGASQIVSATREVLKPRMELEAQLRASGEVRGNLEGTGVVPLLRSVRRARPDARITLRDAFNHFECELRDGRLSQLTRTASDGGFTRGERALPQLLGVSAGRFAVGDLPTLSRPPGVGDIASRQAFEGTLDEVLTRGARELGGLLEALSPRYASRVARVVLDEDAYASTLKHATEGVRKVVERLHRGESPQQLLGKDPGAASLLESLLMELARRGAIRGVVGSSGEDLVADARERRSREAPTQLGTPMSIIPPVPNPVISVLRPPATMSEATPELPSVLDPAAALDHVTAGSPSTPPAAQAATASSSTGSFEPLAESPPLPPVATASTEPPPPGPKPVVPAVEDELPTGQFDPVRKERLEPLAGRNTPVPPPGAQAEASAAQPPGELELPDLPESVGPAPVAAVAPRDSLSSEADILASDERRSKTTMAAWALALVFLIGVGFLIGRSDPDGSPAEVEAIGKRPKPAEVAEPGAPAQPAAATAAAPARGEPLPQGAAPIVPRDSGFEIYDGILDKTRGVAAEQALLIVESSPRLSGAELSVDGTKVGGLPAHVALAEGIHELAIARGDAITYRFASVHRGKTWVLREP